MFSATNASTLRIRALPSSPAAEVMAGEEERIIRKPLTSLMRAVGHRALCTDKALWSLEPCPKWPHCWGDWLVLSTFLFLPLLPYPPPLPCLPPFSFLFPLPSSPLPPSPPHPSLLQTLLSSTMFLAEGLAQPTVKDCMRQA